jgi:hypothetical protein
MHEFKLSKYTNKCMGKACEVGNAIIICDYYMFGWKSKMKVHIFIQYCEWISLDWMSENLVVFATYHSCFGN